LPECGPPVRMAWGERGPVPHARACGPGARTPAIAEKPPLTRCPDPSSHPCRTIRTISLGERRSRVPAKRVDRSAETFRMPASSGKPDARRRHAEGFRTVAIADVGSGEAGGPGELPECGRGGGGAKRGAGPRAFCCAAAAAGAGPRVRMPGPRNEDEVSPGVKLGPWGRRQVLALRPSGRRLYWSAEARVARRKVGTQIGATSLAAAGAA